GTRGPSSPFCRAGRNGKEMRVLPSPCGAGFRALASHRTRALSQSVGAAMKSVPLVSAATGLWLLVPPAGACRGAQDNSAVVAAALEKCAKADGRTINRIVSETQNLVGVEELPTVLRAARDKRAGVRAGAVGLFWRYKKQAANQGSKVVPVLLERLR